MATAARNAAKKKATITKIGIFVPIIVAIIGCMAAGTEPFASWMVTLLPSMATPTPVFVSANPLPGFVADTPYAVSTATSYANPQVEYAPGQDWLANCLSVKWVAYPPQPVSSTNGCLQQPIWNISTKSSGLYIFAQPSALITTNDYGVFVQLPQNATIRVNMDLDAVENGQVWLGLFGEPALASDGMVIVAPPGNVTERAFAVKDPLSQRVIANSRYYNNASGVYSLGFDISNGLAVAVVENEQIKTVSFMPPSRWLFIGYRANLDITNGSADIQAFFSNLMIRQ